MLAPVEPQRVRAAADAAVRQLLAARNPQGWWTGRLSTSALSTATAVAALELLNRDRGDSAPDDRMLVARGLRWLADHQNTDGGWGDTVLSHSNIATTMLARAAFHVCRAVDAHAQTEARAAAYIDRQGGVEAVHARYGVDRTFSAPILTQCALAGLVDWREVARLPFELACLPARFYKSVRLPVVSYALPALIAIGQVREYHGPTWNPLTRLLRMIARRPSLRALESIQPASGGFLEAAPLTSFVAMSLAAVGQQQSPVAQAARRFLVESVLPDGSWPIDTNLATWVTTLSVNALGDDLPLTDRDVIRDWLLGQQNRAIHPYTQADPGGWAWTDLSGGVPDADDTPGALLALARLRQDRPATFQEAAAEDLAVRWLLDLQNRDGGWPTFCRGWGTLPFDRSSADISAHVLRGLHAAAKRLQDPSAARSAPKQRHAEIRRALERGWTFLRDQQRPEGSWRPLWFGNQDAPEEANPVYGTARVLTAYRDTGKSGEAEAGRGRTWLAAVQNPDGGWGGDAQTPSSIEETSLAVEALLDAPSEAAGAWRGVEWLIARSEAGSLSVPSPVGFYFAKLWYFEELYPLIFGTAALRRAAALVASVA